MELLLFTIHRSACEPNLLQTQLLQCLLSPRLNRQKQHTEESSDEETSRCVDGGLGVARASLDSNNGCAETSDTVEETRHSSSSTTDGSGENFWSIRVKDAVHDVLEECLETGECQLEVRVGGDGEQEYEDTGNDGAEGHGTLAANILQVDSVAGEQRAGDTNDGSDSVVAVDGCNIVGDIAARVGKVLWQEGVKQRVSHSDSRPLEPEKTGSDAQGAVLEQSSKPLHRELIERTLDNLHDAKANVLMSDLLVAANIIQDVLGEPSGGLVVVGNSVDGRNSLSLAATRQEEFG